MELSLICDMNHMIVDDTSTDLEALRDGLKFKMVV